MGAGVGNAGQMPHIIGHLSRKPDASVDGLSHSLSWITSPQSIGVSAASQSIVDVLVLVLVVVEVEVEVLLVVKGSHAPQRIGQVSLTSSCTAESLSLHLSFSKTLLHRSDVSSVKEQFRSLLTLIGFAPALSC